MTKEFTYKNNLLAHQGEGYVIVPDQVAEDQKGFDGKQFPAIPATMTGQPIKNAAPVIVRLDGDSYGLHTSGTGDMRVELVKRRSPTTKMTP